MYLPNNSNKLKYLVALISLSAVFSINSYALEQDRKQPIELSADQAKFDDVSQEYILIGHAKVTKGSLVIHGDKAIVIIDPEGFQKITVSSKVGELADFSQKIDGPYQETTEGHGEFIFYDGKEQTLLIKGRASAKKHQGPRWKDKLDADEISYNMDTEKYLAVSASTNPIVRTVIAPKRQEPIKLENK